MKWNGYQLNILRSIDTIDIEPNSDTRRVRHLSQNGQEADIIVSGCNAGHYAVRR